MSHDVSINLEDIRDRCLRIARIASGLSFQQFIAEEAKHDGLLWNLVVIGEAVRGVPEDYRVSHCEIEWPKIAGLRNLLVHEYFGISDVTVWDVVQNKIPVLLQQVQALLNEQAP